MPMPRVRLTVTLPQVSLSENQLPFGSTGNRACANRSEDHASSALHANKSTCLCFVRPIASHDKNLNRAMRTRDQSVAMPSFGRARESERPAYIFNISENIGSGKYTHCMPANSFIPLHFHNPYTNRNLNCL